MDHRLPRRTDVVSGLRQGLVACLGLLVAGAALAAETKAAPSPDPVKLTIKWSTSSEVDNYGFWVMRGDTKEGPFKEANVKVVPGAGNSDLPRKYSFDDTNVEMGKTYYYYLDAISTHGLREKYSPVIEKKCCDTATQKAPEGHEVKEEKPGTAKPAEPAPTPTPSS